MVLKNNTGDFEEVDARCSHVGFRDSKHWKFDPDRGVWKRKRRQGKTLEEMVEDRPCLHEQLERSRPINKKGEPHNLVCNCPKCRTIC